MTTSSLHSLDALPATLARTLSGTLAPPRGPGRAFRRTIRPWQTEGAGQSSRRCSRSHARGSSEAVGVIARRVVRAAPEPPRAVHRALARAERRATAAPVARLARAGAPPPAATLRRV